MRRRCSMKLQLQASIALCARCLLCFNVCICLPACLPASLSLISFSPFVGYQFCVSVGSYNYCLRLSLLTESEAKLDIWKQTSEQTDIKLYVYRDRQKDRQIAIQTQIHVGENEKIGR